MGFIQVQAEKKMYTEWRNGAKDQMIARGFAPAGRTAKDFPDADFLPIYTGMRTLRPACDLIVSAVAANEMHRPEDIEEGVVELVKDSCRKLNDTNNKGKRVVPNPAIPPRQVVVHTSLLPPGAPNQWGAATSIGNPGQLPPNPPPAHVPAGGQLGQAPPGAAGPNVAAAHVNVPAAGHGGQAPPGAPGPNVAAAGQLGQAPRGAAGPIAPAASLNVPAAGQLGQAPPGDAVPNVAAAGQLGQAPPGGLLQMYRLHKSTLLQPDNSDRLLLMRLVPTSLLAENSDRLLRVWLVQTYRLHMSTFLLPDSSDSLPQVMFLRRVLMYLFNLVVILHTHK